MKTSTIIRSLLLPSVVVLAAAGLSGCTVVTDAMNKSVTTTADSREDLSGDIPAWVPADATKITRVAGGNGEAATILLTSAKELDTGTCVATPRLSAPTMQIDDAPDVYSEDEVLSCGDWAVIPSAGGWYGWTPATESSAVPSPTRGK
jgi:hypothetical protein